MGPPASRAARHVASVCPLTADAIEALPLANTPEVFGLHSNAEIGYYTQAARDMWAHLLELQPQTGKARGRRHWFRAGASAQSAAAGAEVPERPGRAAGSGGPGRPQAHTRMCRSPEPRVPVSGDSSSGISRDDYIGQVAKDIENKMPQVFDLDQVRKHLGSAISPTSVVLLQELERFNKLVVRMARSLAELQRVSVAGCLRCVPAWVPAWARCPPPRPSVLSAGLCAQALAGEVGMSSELDDVARSLFIGQIPNIWRKLAPDTLKSLGNWMLYFLRRFSQYTSWVSKRQGPSAGSGSRCSRDPLAPARPAQRRPP